VLSWLKRLLVGRPIATADQEHQRLAKTIALATFSSDAISSTAYATEEILFVTAAGASSLQKGIDVLTPIAVAVAILLVIVVISYRQTIFAYPNGGGSYIVSRENLGRTPSLVAGASLLVDYILTVAVSISAGVAAIISIPKFHSLASDRVALCLAFLVIITLANLRGIKESGRLFALPTYLYIFSVTLMLVLAAIKGISGDLGRVVYDPSKAESMRETGGTLGLFLILRGFSSGAVALSGVEAISNGVPAFKRPESKNAATTLLWMGTILGSLFLGVSILATHVHPFPSKDVTVMSQMGDVVFGSGFFFWLLQLTTCGILILAANTAYADFPRLSSIIARDGYLPRQFSNRGDRLVFSNGILFLAGFAGILIVVFGGETNKLIPLYAIGVFSSFTLSQAGMVLHHRTLREPHWQRGMVINAVGAVATGIVTLIVGITKFTIGAWVPIVVVPLIISLFLAIRRHYDRVNTALEVTPDDVRATEPSHTVIVLVGRVHRGVVRALQYAKSLRPHHLVALYVSFEDDDRREMEEAWERYGITVPLEIVSSPYRELVEPVMRYVDELDQRWNHDTITVVIPEFVVDSWTAQVLHNQSALRLKGRLLFRENTVVTSVPYHLIATDDTPEAIQERHAAARTHGDGHDAH
jgi:amino acid transporter